MSFNRLTMHDLSLHYKHTTLQHNTHNYVIFSTHNQYNIISQYFVYTIHNVWNIPTFEPL